MEQPLDPRVRIGQVRLSVADLDRSVTFYARVLGFMVRRGGTSLAFLGTGEGHDEIVLAGSVAGTPQADVAPGHFAIRYPDRVTLADALVRLDAAHVTVESAQDDGVTEGIGIRDPDGNSIELYWSRPTSARRNHDAAPVALDLDLLRALARRRVAVAESGPPAPLADIGRQQLGELRGHLLDLHKVLLEDTRAAYELDRGRVGSNANLLQLVINDPWFAWLRAVSELVVRIDEILANPRATAPDATTLVAQVERLLTASETGDAFARRYYEALQRQPAVVLAHADVRRTLKAMR